MQKKIRRAKKRRNKSIGCMAIFVCIFLVTVFALGSQEKINLPKIQRTENYSINQESICDSNEKDWCLVLVNKWNPIESSNEDIKLVELSNGEFVDSRIYPQLQKMFDDMRKDGVYPIVASGYRTQKEQQEIYEKKLEEYIETGYSKEEAKIETEKWVAIPGTSEHQLGLGIDINADGINSYGREVYSWLSENAHCYGFIYRYPENKINITGIANEPWHYRYVGVEAATEIYDKNICLEEYIEEINGGA